MYKTCTFTVRTKRNVSILITKSCISPNSKLEIQFDSKIVLRVKLISYCIFLQTIKHQKLLSKILINTTKASKIFMVKFQGMQWFFLPIFESKHQGSGFSFQFLISKIQGTQWFFLPIFDFKISRQWFFLPIFEKLPQFDNFFE